MSDQGIASTFREMPRAARWGIVGIAVIVGLLAYDQFVLTTARGLHDRADRIQDTIDNARKGDERIENVRRSRRVIEAYGAVELPSRDPDKAGEELFAVITEVITPYMEGGGERIRNFRRELRAAERLPDKLAAGLISGGERASVVSAQVRFDAEPDDVTSIIAALEGRPEIDRITKVQLTKGDEFRRRPQVQVTLDLERWVVTKHQAPARRGGV